MNNLDENVTRQGMSMVHYLASSAEYGVVSGNTAALGALLDRVMQEPGVKGALVNWPDQSSLSRGEANTWLPTPDKATQWQLDDRIWFAAPVRLAPADTTTPFFENSETLNKPLAWVAVCIDLQQKQALARDLLLASLGITLAGLTLAMLLINKLALSGLKPLLNIISAVKSISMGSFGHRVEVTARSPELRELQDRVNQMSESLRSYQQEMEAKVHAATSELEHKKQEAEQATRAKSRFLAAASHDLRQPMHAISLYVESLKPQMRGRAAEDTLDKIERSIHGTVELFNAILDVTKLDAGVIKPRLAPLHIRQLLRHLAEEFAAESDSKGLSLRIHAPQVWVFSDAILLERILRNLLSNALRHTAQGGILLSARHYKNQVRLQVWDTGSGIPPEQQQRIFEEFYQGEEMAHRRQGVGLGLAIVRHLARLLGHPLHLNSRTGRGSVFTLDVPMLPQHHDEAHEQHAHAAALTGRVLVIDDDPEALDALGSLLRHWGMNVQAFSDPNRAMQAYQGVPDIVLTDYQLRDGQTGLMVVQAVHARWGEQIPVALITGDTRTETAEVLQQSRMPVLQKPVRPDQLHALLSGLLLNRSSP